MHVSTRGTGLGGGGAVARRRGGGAAARRRSGGGVCAHGTGDDLAGTDAARPFPALIHYLTARAAPFPTCREQHAQRALAPTLFLQTGESSSSARAQGTAAATAGERVATAAGRAKKRASASAGALQASHGAVEATEGAGAPCCHVCPSSFAAPSFIEVAIEQQEVASAGGGAAEDAAKEALGEQRGHMQRQLRESGRAVAPCCDICDAQMYTPLPCCVRSPPPPPPACARAPARPRPSRPGPPPFRLTLSHACTQVPAKGLPRSLAA